MAPDLFIFFPNIFFLAFQFIESWWLIPGHDKGAAMQNATGCTGRVQTVHQRHAAPYTANTDERATPCSCEAADKMLSPIYYGLSQSPLVSVCQKNLVSISWAMRRQESPTTEFRQNENAQTSIRFEKRLNL